MYFPTYSHGKPYRITVGFLLNNNFIPSSRKSSSESSDEEVEYDDKDDPDYVPEEEEEEEDDEDESDEDEEEQWRNEIAEEEDVTIIDLQQKFISNVDGINRLIMDMNKVVMKCDSFETKGTLSLAHFLAFIRFILIWLT